MNRIFRCKLQRADGMRVDYIGPFGQWSPEWHIVLRTAATHRRAA